MKLTRSLRKIYFLYIVTFLLAFANIGIAGNYNFTFNLPGIQVADTVIIDTTGNLPYPFQDQPAFGHSNQDSIKLFLKKPSNIKYEIEYDPITGQYVFYEKIGNLNYRLPQTMSLDDYVDYDFEKSIKDYWIERSRIKALDDQRGLIPKLLKNGAEGVVEYPLNKVL